MPCFLYVFMFSSVSSSVRYLSLSVVLVFCISSFRYFLRSFFHSLCPSSFPCLVISFVRYVCISLFMYVCIGLFRDIVLCFVTPSFRFYISISIYIYIYIFRYVSRFLFMCSLGIYFITNVCRSLFF